MSDTASDYTPTTEDIVRNFTAPTFKIDPQRDGETLGVYLSRLSMESMHLQNASEAAAHRWLERHDKEVAAKALRDAADDFGIGRGFDGTVANRLRDRASTIARDGGIT